MRAFRNITVLLGLALMLFGFTATVAKAQALSHVSYSGTFTLPFDVQWGSMVLPAGDYSLFYGHMPVSGTYLVEVAGKDAAGPHGYVLPIPGGDRLEWSENSLICVREGNEGYVRELRMGFIGESAHFTKPHGVIVRARVVKQTKNKAKTPHEEARMSIVRVPVKLSGR